MRSFARWMVPMLALLAPTFAAGCSSSQEEEEDEDVGALGEMQSGTVIETARGKDLKLFEGYNILLDQGTKNECVRVKPNVLTTVGDSALDVKVSFVKSRDELARQLGFNTDLGFKLPTGAGGDARADVLRSFKKSASTITLLVRAGFNFTVSASDYTIEPDKAALLASNPAQFLKECGDSVITGIQYRSEAIGLLRFDTNDQEQGLKAASTVGVNGNVKSIAEAKAQVGGSIEKMKQASRAQMNLELRASGFAPEESRRVQAAEAQTDPVKALDDLLAVLSTAIEADRKRALEAATKGTFPTQVRQGVGGIRIDAKPFGLIYQSYAKQLDTTELNKITNSANKFLIEVGDVQGKLNNILNEEVNAFFSASPTDQIFYNMANAPKNNTRELEAPANKWRGELELRTGGRTVNSQLADIIQECVAGMMIKGDGAACQRTDRVAQLLDQADKQLKAYDRERIFRMAASLGAESADSADKAKAACSGTGGRFPTAQELPLIAPAVNAKTGAAWVSIPTASCSSGAGIVERIGAAPDCYNWERLNPFLDGAPVYCVPVNGPRGAITKAGE